MALSDVSFDSGLSKHKFGASNIRFSPDGRLLSDETTLSLPRGRSYGAARDFDNYPRSDDGNYSRNNRGNYEDYTRNNRNTYGDYNSRNNRTPYGDYTSHNNNNNFEDKREKARQAFYEYHGAYPSYESQSVQRQPPAGPASSHMSRDRMESPRPERHHQKNRQVQNQSRPWSGQYDTGFDSVRHLNHGWVGTQEHSPIRRYDTSQGYGTRDQSSYPSYSAQPPVPPMDQRRGLPRDPYSSYSPNKPDWHAPVVGDYHYDKTGLIAARNRNGEYGILGKWYHKRKDSPWSVLFLTLGMFILLCGLVNVLICVDYHYYCRFWGGFIILEFGILGMIHAGDWKSRWKSYSYILLGILSVIAAFTSTALLFEKYIPQLKLLADLDNTTAYEELQKARDDDPHVNIEDDAWVWICFGFDLTTFCLFALSYLAAHASASCANRFYDFNWKCTKSCEPYSKPRCFNPFGQILLGEAMAFIGICVRYGCESYLDDTEWYKFWSPVSAGALTAIAGSCAAGATKRTDNTSLVLVAIFVELLAGAAAVVAVVFCCMGLADNVEVIQDISTLTSQQEDHLIASACLYGIAAGVCFIQVIYAIGVLASLFSSLLGKRQHRYYGNRGSVRSFDSRSQTTVTTQRDRYGRHVGGGVDFPRSNYWRR